MLANWYADGEPAFRVGFYQLAVLGADSAVNVEVYTLHRIVCAGVEYRAADGE